MRVFTVGENQTIQTEHTYIETPHHMLYYSHLTQLSQIEIPFKYCQCSYAEHVFMSYLKRTRVGRKTKTRFTLSAQAQIKEAIV